MGLKNDVKKKYFVASATAKNGSIVTVVGMQQQTSTKECITITRTTTTAGGTKVLAVDPEVIVLNTFENQDGIRKELYMGYSICHKDDVADYDIEKATELAERRFSRPLVTYNFTYLNDDMCELLVENEAEYIANNIQKYTKE